MNQATHQHRFRSCPRVVRPRRNRRRLGRAPVVGLALPAEDSRQHQRERVYCRQGRHNGAPATLETHPGGRLRRVGTHPGHRDASRKSIRGDSRDRPERTGARQAARFRHSAIVWWVEPGERWRPPFSRHLRVPGNRNTDSRERAVNDDTWTRTRPLWSIRSTPGIRQDIDRELNSSPAIGQRAAVLFHSGTSTPD